MAQANSGSSRPAPGASAPLEGRETRRGFGVQLAALVTGGVAFLTPLVVGLFAFLDPLRRRASAAAWVRLGAIDAVPADGIPRAFPVVMDRADAWNRFPREPVGSVYLRRTADGQVTALNAICPHAGCFVDFHAAVGRYQCPCHDSRFRPDGVRIGPDCPSPRDLDALELDAARLAQGEVWVKFQNFRAGKAEKIPE